MKALFASRNRLAAERATTLARFAATELALLVEGETGTGKSFVATRIHRRSRPRQPLVVVDCGALSPTLVASELFGHRAGAFTDATRPHRGWLEQVGDGTLVLDRLELLDASGQVALLRALEERRFFPVGGGQARPFRARVVALADAGVRARLAQGVVRLDLYHRLAGLHVELPPLRERPEDVLPFARATLARAESDTRLRFDAEAERLLCAYPWPGNFRELDALVRRAALAARGETVGAAELDLPPDSWPAVAAHAHARAASLAEVERLYALWVLAREAGNVSRAARVLGISRRTLIRWRAQ